MQNNIMFIQQKYFVYGNLTENNGNFMVIWQMLYVRIL